MLCSKLHSQKDFNLILFSYSIVPVNGYKGTCAASMHTINDSRAPHKMAQAKARIWP